VLRDDGHDLLGQAEGARLLGAELDVAADDGRGEARRQLVVLVVARLVLDEVLGLLDLPDVVVVGADAREEGVRADLPAGRLGEVATVTE